MKQKQSPKRNNQTASQTKRSKPDKATVTFTVSGLISVGELKEIIAEECAILSTDAMKRWIYDPELCPKHELYNGLWYLEDRHYLVEPDTLPLFVRHIPPARKAFLREMIRERLYFLEKETFNTRTKTNITVAASTENTPDSDTPF